MTQAQAEELTAWEKAERNSKTLILQRVPGSMALLLHPMPTVSAIRTKCPALGNVREFLDSLSTRREELSPLGVVISEDYFRSTIVGCLPQYLSGFASSQLSAAKLFSSTGTIPCGPFMTAISEYDRKEGERKWHGKGKDGMVMSTKGHFARDCKKPKRPKDSMPTAKTSNGTAVAVDWDSESEGAWAVNIASDSDESEMPELQLVLDSEDGSMPDLQAVAGLDDESDGESSTSDWFSEVGEDDGEHEPSCSSPEELSEVDGNVSNGVDISKLHLTEVLYSPEIGYTLISIGRLDDAGVATTFSNGTCTLRRPGGERINEVPKLEGACIVLCHNGVVECRNRTIVEQVHALLAFHEICGQRPHGTLYGCMSTKAVDGMMPYEAIYGHEPDL
ncbi:hypothetical protein B0H14DRAFT_3650259 [Mycena olivaceomarginata]|nr:hypothetical protein B0H14DRAFT_3650259 [Mycena olivaceomarginata]